MQTRYETREYEFQDDIYIPEEDEEIEVLFNVYLETEDVSRNPEISEFYWQVRKIEWSHEAHTDSHNKKIEEFVNNPKERRKLIDRILKKVEVDDYESYINSYCP